MEQEQLTTSAVIHFAERLEDSSAAFYTALAERFAEHQETFLAYAKEGKKNKTLVVRTYQETITDMLEACYCFEGLSLNQHLTQPTLTAKTSLSQAVKMAVALEETAVTFYLDVAERSQSLLATIPRAFRKAAEVHNKRKAELPALLAGSR